LHLDEQNLALQVAQKTLLFFPCKEELQAEQFSQSIMVFPINFEIKLFKNYESIK
jgi:BarA-like signal transduction histidine kinase